MFVGRTVFRVIQWLLGGSGLVGTFEAARECTLALWLLGGVGSEHMAGFGSMISWISSSMQHVYEQQWRAVLFHPAQRMRTEASRSRALYLCMYRPHWSGLMPCG